MQKKIDSIIIYSSSPVKQVVAEADVADILEGTPKQVWATTEQQSGISSCFFFKYYEGRTRAIAYKLANIKKFKVPKTLEDYGVSSAPQSFVYVQ